MPRKPKVDADTITTLEQRLAKAQRLLRAARNTEKKQARADDARRKIIAGALALEHFAKNPGSEFGKIMFRLLDEYARPDERFLFEFLPVRDPPAVQDNTAPDDPGKLETAPDKPDNVEAAE
jgi:hypothetical protein